MKKVFAIGLALVMALGLFGCAKGQAEQQTDRTPVAPGTAGAASVRPAEPEDIPEHWDYDVTQETELEEYQADDGTLLATWSYEQPRLVCVGGDAASSAPPAEMQAVCDAFNAAMDERMQSARAGFEDMKASALEQYTEMGGAFFAPHTEETTVTAVDRRGDLLNVTMLTYGYWGGAHGGMTVRHLHFDLAEGEFVTLNDLSDDPAALRAAIADEILGQISGEEDGFFFDGYEDTIRGKDDFNAFFDEDGVTVLFDQYEIAPYAYGMPEFTVGYDVLAPYLNARGQRLLGETA